MSKSVILTGLRANTNLHIGNYLGALLPMIDMAKQHAGEYQINLFVPDLHSFTTPIDHDILHEQILQNLKVYTAAGLPLDHEDVYIYRQSYVPAHSELTWILDCFTTVGELSRMTQFKEKARQKSRKLVTRLDAVLADYFNEQKEQLTEKQENLKAHLDALRKELVYQTILEEGGVGLFNYPVLMACDVLLYNASYVPVGDDQTQHLEFMRNIAERMNNKFGDLFVVPKPVKEQHEFFNKDQGLRIRDLLDPTKKMSKSDETGKGVIFLSDTPEAARKKIMGATTDSLSKVQYDYKERPGISNLLDLLKLLGGNPDEFIGQDQYGPLKTAVADKVAEFLKDFQSRLEGVDEQALIQKLESSESAMNEVANQTLYKVQQAVGLRSKS